MAFLFHANAINPNVRDGRDGGNHWTPDVAQFANSMTVIGVVQIDGVEQATTDLEVGAFCNDVCRGTHKLAYYSAINRYLLFLDVFGEDGDVISFRLYDHGLGEELDVTCSNTLTFSTNGNHGNPMSPYVIDFEAATVSYTISASASPSNGGSVSGAGTYEEGQSCTLTATPSMGYTFFYWTKNGSQVSTSASYTFTVTENASYVAVFGLNWYLISVSANPSAGGTVSGGGSYSHGSTCSLTATPNAGYTFLRWTKNGSQVSTSASYTFTVTEAASYVAVFSQNSYTITASANPSDGGSVSGAGSYSYGETCSLTATPGTGYSFVRWTKNGSQVSTSATYSFTVTENASYVAVFSLNSYTITASANPSEGGTVSGGGSYSYGSTCSLTATPNTGYAFVNWTENGSAVSSDATMSFTVTGNRSLVANFTVSQSDCHWIPSDSQYANTMTAIGVIQIDGVEQRTTDLELGAFCNDVCRGTHKLAYYSQVDRYLLFLDIYGNDGDVIDFRLYDHALGEELDVTCTSTMTFATNANHGTPIDPYVFLFETASVTYTINATANPSEGGTVSGTGSYNEGENCTMTATSNSGYTFANWTENGAVVSSSATYSFTVTGDRTLVANFISGLVIGDGTATSYYVPIGTYYNYSITEQLYTDDEIGTAGTINSISFYYAGTAAKDFPIKVYMQNVDAGDLSTGISLADADMVFDGTYSVTGEGWFSIDLDTPFAYDGISNLLIGVIKDNLQWYNGGYWQCTAVNNMARYTQSDSAGPYDTSTTPGTVSANRPNIIIDITPDSGPTCDKPGTLEASNVTANSAVLTWSGGSGTYNLEYKSNAATEWTTILSNTSATTYALSGLTSNTAYVVRVQSVCDGVNSGWRSVEFTAMEVCPDGMVCIGSGTVTNNFLPTQIYYKYSLTQQIYTAAEIGEAGAVLSLGFHSTRTHNNPRSLDIYMVNTDKSVFSSNTDWIVVTSGDLVFSGEVIFVADDWTTIELDAPFVYDGVSNLAIVVDDNTGGYETTTPFYVFDASSQAIRIYSDGSDYDPESPTSYSGTVLNVKNRIRLAMGEPPACPKPTGLAINNEDGLTAEVTWNGDASTYNINVNGTVTEGVTSPYTLSGLELATTYEVMVQAVCSSETSDWAGPVSFTTDLCLADEKCLITFELTDSYGDGWNGNAIQVTDVLTGAVLGQFANTSAAGAGEAQIYTLSVCDGRDIQFSWVSGSYPGETSYAVYDLNENLIFSGSGVLSDPVDHTVNCTETTCRTPADLTASEIGPRSAKLSWTERGEATEWVVRYTTDLETFREVSATTNPFTLTDLESDTYYGVFVRPVCSDFDDMWSEMVFFATLEACAAPDLDVTPTPVSATVDWTDFEGAYEIEWAVFEEYEPSADALWLQYDDETVVTNVGNSTVYEWTWGVMYPDSLLNGNSYLNKVAFYESSYYLADAPITINIYGGGSDAPETLLYTQGAKCLGTVGVHEVVLTSPVAIDPSQNLWITLTTTTIDRPMAMCAVNEANGRWVDNGGWMDIGTALTSVSTYSFMIRGFIDSTGPTYEWHSETEIKPPYTIEDLEPETDYVVRVKASCGTKWATTTFTTPSACDAPLDLEATDVTDNSATLNWTGYQDSYNVQYRKAASYTPIWEEDFENGIPETWTIAYGEDATAPASGYWYTVNPVNGLSFEAHSGSYVASSWSWNNSAYNADNWLITPQLDLQGVLRYFVRTNTGYADSYEVLLSTTTAETPSFTITLKEMAPAPALSQWNEVIIDLSAYEGQQGYIAIHHVDYDMNYLCIDDFGLYEYEAPGEWITATPTETTLALTGLDPETDYEWQVQGINASCDGGLTEWTEIAEFTTLEAPVITEVDQDLALAAGWNWWSSYLEMDATVEDALKDAIAAENTTATIKSMTGNIMLEEGAWSTGVTLNNESMFMILVDNPVTTTLTAAPADPTQHTITLNPGWNWIGFPSANPMALAEALAGITPNEEDVIKGSASNATYTADYGWNGSLTSLTPGMGYMYLNGGTSALTLTYPATSKGFVRSLPMERYWTNDTHRFATNMVMLATLDADRFAMAAGNYEIGAFVGDECRGSARLQQVGSHYIAYLTIGGNTGEAVHFRLYDVANAMELGLAEEQMTYVANAVTGTTHEPVVLHFRSTGIGEGDHNMVSVYPNPTKDKVMVEGDAIETVKVYNVLGQLVQMEQCGNTSNVELHLNGLSAGVYTVEVTNAYGTVNRRIVKE